MTYTTQEIAKALGVARKGKGLSQRMLARLAGVPQSHISKIENGAVDLRLSSLIEIARALDLEVALVPRKNISAVQSIVRSGERSAPQGVSSPLPVRELLKLQNAVGHALKEYPAVKELAQLQRQIRDMQELAKIQLPDFSAFREVTRAVQAFRDSASSMSELQRSLSHIQQLRNALAHKVSGAEAVKSAYSLDEHDDRG